MRQIHDGLNGAFKGRAANFIEQYSHNNRDEKRKQDPAKADDQRIDDGALEGRGHEQRFEIVPPYPRASHNAIAIGEFFERQLYAVHGNIAENDKVNKSERQQQV